jgi:radical S-adenosyl methionine domain-containing protein 2
MKKSLLLESKKINLWNVSWHITDRCNYNCKFCFRPKHGREVSLEKAKKVVDKLARAGLTKISFAGGEPLLWKGMLELIEYTKKKGIVTMLITNGELLDSKKQKRLVSCLDWLNIPLEGPSSRMNELMTRKKGHFNRTIKLMKWANDNNIKLKVNTVAAKQNKDVICEMVDLIKKYKVKRWKVFQFYPVRGIAKKNKQMFVITGSDFLRIKEEVLRLMENRGCMVVFETNDDMDRSYFAVSPDSEVFVSYKGIDFFIGNLYKEKIKNIWSHPILDKVKYWERSRWVEPKQAS